MSSSVLSLRPSFATLRWVAIGLLAALGAWLLLSGLVAALRVAPHSVHPWVSGLTFVFLPVPFVALLLLPGYFLFRRRYEELTTCLCYFLAGTTFLVTMSLGALLDIRPLRALLTAAHVNPAGEYLLCSLALLKLLCTFVLGPFLARQVYRRLFPRLLAIFLAADPAAATTKSIWLQDLSRFAEITNPIRPFVFRYFLVFLVLSLLQFLSLFCQSDRTLAQVYWNLLFLPFAAAFLIFFLLGWITFPGPHSFRRTSNVVAISLIVATAWIIVVVGSMMTAMGIVH